MRYPWDSAGQGGKTMIARTPNTRRVDSGVYLFPLELARPRTFAIGFLGNIRFEAALTFYALLLKPCQGVKLE